ncbi:MAG TPA: LemA family protein [Candidatus Izemoplasmatales bacterium]|nr:LemA family protein [Bacillota bacterium]HRY77185.1 LemA family protein [Candidatus Izemoplasmatales bacterium]
MFLASLGGTIGIIVAILAVVIIVFFVISVYNQLVVMRNKVRNGWSQIDVQLKRRFDLIPNLVETVKGYAAHEEGIFSEFARARGLYAQAQKSGDVGQMAEAEKGLSGTLSRLLMVQEQYPELKANDNFKELMAQLKDTEDKISFNRQFYNDTVLAFNNKIELFPSNIVARMFKFEAAKFFEVSEEAERQGVKIKF